MRDVCSSAHQVIMWLGEPDVGDEPPTKKIETSHEMIEGMKTLWPSWVYNTLKPYLDEDHLTGPEKEPYGSKIGDDLRYREIIDQLPTEVRPVFYTAPVADLGVIDENDKESCSLVLSTLLSESFNALNDVADLLQHNSFSRQQDGLKRNIFDWRQSSEVPKFFMGPQDPQEWPILGAFSIVYFLATSKHLTTIPFFAKDENIAKCVSQSWLKSVTALQDLLDNAYWTRAWITQEIVLAEDPVIYYGRHVMTFKMLATTQVVLEQHKNNLCYASALQEHSVKACSDTPVWTSLANQFRRIEDITEMWLQNAHARARGKDVATPWSHILSFNLTRRYATNPLDHVYGILGLVSNEGPEKIAADYLASPVMVYSKASEQVIKTSSSLKILASHTAARQKSFQLPSWVPDWSTGESDIGIAYLWNPSKLSEKIPTVSFYDDHCLGLESHCTDEVDVISSQIEDCTDCSLYHRVKVISSWREIASLTDEIDPSLPRETEFWRTLFADHLFNIHAVSDRKAMTFDDISRAQKWWQWIVKIGKQPPQMIVFGGKQFFDQPSLAGRDDEMDQMIHILTRRKVIFITKSGRLATARGPIEKGDQIHLVQGCGFPLILRRAEKPDDIKAIPASSSPPKVAGKQKENNGFLDLSKCSHDARNVFHYISDAYVHGVMNAEITNPEDNPPTAIFIR